MDISFHHTASSKTKGIILNHLLKSDFSIKFKLNYSVIVNFFMGSEHIINFRNESMKSDFALKVNVWHDMEFKRKNGILSVFADGNLIKTMTNDQSLFIVRIYNNDRNVHIKDFSLSEEISLDFNELDFIKDKLVYIEKNMIDLVSKEDLDKKYENVLTSYNNLFNTLYLDYELKPRPFMKYMHELNDQLLLFFKNVCEKYDLEWWLDYGNLIGALRHGYHIPWDDDVDVAMVRKDYNKFNDIIQYEIENNNLNNIKLDYRTVYIDDVASVGFLQILYVYKGIYLTNFDVYAYDFMKVKPNNLNDEFENCRINFNKDIVAGKSIDEILERYYNDLNLSYEYQPYLMMGVDGSCGPKNLCAVKIFDSDKIFPLKQIKFGDFDVWAPKDPDYYLKLIFGDYMVIPRTLRYKSRMAHLRRKNNIVEYFKDSVNDLKRANENFK